MGMSRTLAVSVLLLAVPAQESRAQAVDTLEVDDGEVETPAVIPLPPPRIIPRVIPLPPRRPAGLVPDQAAPPASPLSAAPSTLAPTAPPAAAAPPPAPVVAAPSAAPMPAPPPAQSVSQPPATPAPAAPPISPVVVAPSAAPMPAPPPAQSVSQPPAASAPAAPPVSPVVAAPSAAPIPAPPAAQSVNQPPAAPVMVAPAAPAPLQALPATTPVPVPTAAPVPVAAPSNPMSPTMPTAATLATPQTLAAEPYASLPLPQRARNEAALELPPTGLLGSVQSRLWGLKSGLSEWWYGAPSTYAADYARREKLFEAAMAAAGFEIASLASEGVFFRTQSVVFIERREPTPLEIEAAERLANELAQEFGGLRGYAEQAAIREALDPSGRDPALQKTIEVQLSPYPWVKSISGLTASAGRKAP